MAMLITTDNKPVFVPAVTANQLWLVKTGERRGTKEIMKKVSQVKRWYLNRMTAPQSYLDTYPPYGDYEQKALAESVRLPYAD
jgi:hypothetical protein